MVHPNQRWQIEDPVIVLSGDHALQKGIIKDYRPVCQGATKKVYVVRFQDDTTRNYHAGDLGTLEEYGEASDDKG